MQAGGGQWLSGRVLSFGSTGCWFESNLHIERRIPCLIKIYLHFRERKKEMTDRIHEDLSAKQSVDNKIA